MDAPRRDLHILGTVTILDGAAVSDAIAIPAGYAIAGIGVADSWSTADLGFKVDTGGGTYVDVYAGVGTTVARARLTGVPTSGPVFVGVPQAVLNFLPLGCNVKLTSITTTDNTDANQTGNIVLTVWIARAE